MNAMLIGKTKTGKTGSLETLPGGTVDYSFDSGGWRCLTEYPQDAQQGVWAKPSTAKHGRRRKWVKVIPKFAEWFKGEEILQPDQILVVDYVVKAPIEDTQYTHVNSELVMTYIRDVNLLWDFDKARAKGICHFATDSLTSMQRPVVEYILAMQGRVTTSIGDYGLAINKMDEIVASCVSLPFDFIFICHTQMEKDEKTGTIEEVPLIYGKQLPNQLLARFDEIFITLNQPSPSGVGFFWCPAPEGFMRSAGTRNFDVNSLPSRLEPNFRKLYGEKLCCAVPNPVQG